MNLQDRTSAAFLDEADREACARLEPLVRQGCGSLPAPHVLASLQHSAARYARRQRILPFVRVGCAAAALITATLTDWPVARTARQAVAERKGQLLADALFLCDEGAGAAATPPAADEPDLAQRLLKLQGLDTVAAPTPKAAEPPAPPSIDSQSGETVFRHPSEYRT